MDKLQKLIKGCKVSVHIEINAHRGVYEDIKDAIEEIEDLNEERCAEPGIRKKMIEKDTLIEIKMFPHYPGSHYAIFHYNINSALDEALECLEEDKRMRGGN